MDGSAVLSIPSWLWKVPVDVFSVEKPYKGDGVTFHGQTKAVVTNPDTPDTIVVAAASEFLEVGYLPKMLRLFNQLYQLPDPCSYAFVLDIPQIPDEAFCEPDGH